MGGFEQFYNGGSSGSRGGLELCISLYAGGSAEEFEVFLRENRFLTKDTMSAVFEAAC